MGKPGHRHGWSPAREGTWGTETSKYPEDEMPPLAASEEGRAQTEKLRLFGVEDRQNRSQA